MPLAMVLSARGEGHEPREGPAPKGLWVHTLEIGLDAGDRNMFMYIHVLYMSTVNIDIVM